VTGGDGRNIDPSLGLLQGEGSDQEVPEDRSNVQGGPPFEVWTAVPSVTDGPREEGPTYYDRPVIKEPTWIWSVPAYFYAGGAAGAAAVLGAAAQAADGDGLHGLVRRCRWIAAVGGALGTVFLIIDLGRPGRFLNMLRVFRPTSPMNLGSWMLAATAPLAAGSAVLADAPGLLGAVGDGAGYGAAVFGMPLAGYTAVLVSNTAVPVWRATRRSGPPLFVASAITAAASLLQMMDLSDREQRIVRRFAVAGAIAELGASFALDRESGGVEEVARPLREGTSGALLKAAKAFTGASLAMTIAPGRGRLKSAAAGLLGTAGSLCAKFGLFHAGKASARNPRATFAQQSSPTTQGASLG
jgi:formate-dependent nitrite reductase membrane component NrfD